MEWKIKVELVKALNKGDNEKACDIILKNDMDAQAWAMFLTGMTLIEFEEYRPLLEKIKEAESLVVSKLGLRENLRYNMLIAKLEGKEETSCK